MLQNSIRGYASSARRSLAMMIKRNGIGKAKPFRTSSGEAAALSHRRRRLLFWVVERRLRHPGANAVSDSLDGDLNFDLRARLCKLALDCREADHLFQDRRPGR